MSRELISLMDHPLSPAIHAILACDLNQTDEAYHHFQQAAFVDLEDLRGNGHEGIHGASAGGVWQSRFLGLAGLNLPMRGQLQSLIYQSNGIASHSRCIGGASGIVLISQRSEYVDDQGNAQLLLIIRWKRQLLNRL